MSKEDTVSSGTKNTRRVETFLVLSERLTGSEGLNRDLGAAYLERLLRTPSAAALLRAFIIVDGVKREDLDKAIAEQILADTFLNAVAVEIVMLWFTSALPDNPSQLLTGAPVTLRYDTEEEYFSGMIWALIGAHAPGLSGGYFGHWRYAPSITVEGGEG